MSQSVITDDLNALLEVLPRSIKASLQEQPDVSQLTEIVLDLGRLPEARFPHREITLINVEITVEDIDYVTSRISTFGGDNRADPPDSP